MSDSIHYSLEDWASRKRLMLAVVFTDVVGSTSLRKHLGDEAMEEIIQQHFTNASSYIVQNDGYEIKTIGDEVMAVFPTAGDALNYVLDLYENTGHAKIKIRGTIHVGTVTVVESDIRGTMVHLAARVSKLPRGANIYVTEDAQVQITQVKSQRHASLVSRRRKVQIKDFEGVNQVWDVMTPKMREAMVFEIRKRLVAPSTQSADAPLGTPLVPSRSPRYNVRPRDATHPVLERPMQTTKPTSSELLARLINPPQQKKLGVFEALLGNQSHEAPNATSLFAELLRRGGEKKKE